MTNNQSDPFIGIKKLPIIAVLLTGAFIAILNQTLLTTALPVLMADLNIDANLGQWVTTAFMLVNGVMIPITAFLIEKFTTRRLFITAMGLFGLGTLVCAMAPTFEVLITGRMIQAAGAGIAMPLMQTVLLLIFPVEKRGAAMGMVGLVISFAPAIGPTLSGWLVQSYHWSILFWLLMPIVVIDIIAAYLFLKNVTTQRSPKLDSLSIILSSIGFGGLLFGFSNAGSNGWTDATVFTPIIVGAITLTWFILRQLKLPQPILEFRVFKYWVFTLTTLIGMIVFMSMIGAATIFPIYMQTMHNFTAFESGLMLLPGAIVMGIMSPITGRIFDKVGARYLTIIGLGMIFVTTFLFTDLTDSTSMTYVTVVYSFRMLGVALVMMPVTTAGINVLPRHLIPHGTAMNNTMRQIAGSIGTAVLVSVMTTAAIRHAETGEMGMLEAEISGVNTAFMVATGISFVGFVLAFFIKSKGKQTETHDSKAREQKPAIEHS
ncbi:DHA2 family efflux MFS transporter permease subunit [Alkalicoccobacillus porphyridii]|uniref:DHA2 family efflux MFS transporter permease subunit n=1 Tax=Alkalicoccobacillus porphyridii TaxID=2597270 RepID=A0A553ZYU7_9BACI|nr:DHA2 family efflux MFS transporter permease subunit [Alkalicoccobacillus porphyridii]TSB46556.1 DHA2 family efflux MFS transporter permease subunit [Alkalicoccobacillus porphyridii]